MLQKPLVFIDVETTGCSYYTDRIIEIGALKVFNHQLVSTYHTLINPEVYLPPEITHLTGILPQDLETAPTFNQIKHELFELMDGAIFVAHNSSFDYGFVRTEFKRHGTRYSTRHLCTVKLSRSLFPKERRHNLDAVIDRCGLRCSNRHRALGDAEVLWQFWQYLHNHFPPETIEAAVKNLLKTPSLPTNISRHTINQLPETPGVYLFYNAENAPLYVGKSVSLKDRILSHFAAASTSPRERHLSASIQSLETIKTAGDLHAQLLESHLIKTLQPIYNRQLRYAQSLIVLKQATNSQGYFTPEVKDLSAVALAKEGVHTSGVDFLGIFRSVSQAKNRLSQLCDKYSLCPKLLTLESGSGACFNYHLGKCHGACIGKENYLKYNIRFTEAFTPLKLKRWPFPRSISIHERFDDLEALHTINDWQLLDIKTNYSLNKISPLASFISHPFDFDTYKILVRYLLNPRHQSHIHLLT